MISIRGIDGTINAEEIRSEVISRVDLSEDITDDRLHEIIDLVLSNYYESRYVSLDIRWAIHREIFDSIRGLGVLQELLEDDAITEIMVNDFEHIFVEKEGRIFRHKGKFVSPERLDDVIQQIVGQNNKRVNESNPIVDTRLKDGSRVSVVLSPISLSGSSITIRKFPKRDITMQKLIEIGSITYEAAMFLKKLVEAKYNIFISGGTGSGKTTFLNALSDFIPKDERIITIEDSAELRLHNVQNIVSLEARQENLEGENEIAIRDLIKASLRMRPDRIIVGEIRGKEALDMLQAMNTGHDGSMSTGHANTSRDMITRIETMVLMGVDMPVNAIRGQIASAVDIVVHLGRMKDKSRKVLQIDEVVGIEEGNVKLQPIFRRDIVKGKQDELVRTDNQMINTEKLERNPYELF